MKGEIIVDRIRDNADAIKKEGATALYIYGSRARGDTRPDSDLDVFIEFDPESRFSLMEMVGIKHTIEDELGLEVHITTRDSLHPMLKDDIERQAIRVF